MSLTSSLNSALAGLDLSARRAEVIARNVSSADSQGYARRSVASAGAGIGLPGRGAAITRDIDPRLMQLRREAQSRSAGEETLQAFFTRLDKAIGQPDDPGSLQDGLARLDAAFVSAAADPTSSIRLTEISEAAAGVASTLNALDDVVQGARQGADADIGKAVEGLNRDLAGVARLNADILRLNAGRHDSSDLLDQRTVLIDRISQQIPVRELPRDDGTVALVSVGGVLLLDGRPAQLGFAPRAPITAAMSAPTHLSGLTVNGRTIQTGGAVNAIPGGNLTALFQLRDEIAPQATARFDAMAAELIARFEDPAVDGTIAPGGTGLFTDRGLPLDPAADAGLAGRIAINALVTPDRPDQHWRLRDGLGAAGAGSGGDASLLLRYGDAFAERRQPVLAGLPDIGADLAGHAAALRSLVSADRVRADDRLGFARIEATTLAEGRDGGRVDIDAEMRRLVEVEQAYAANARIIQAVSDMMNRLTEI